MLPIPFLANASATQEPTPPMPIIGVHTRHHEDTVNLIKTFYLRFPQFRWFTFRDLRGLSHEEFANGLKDCFMSVWIDPTSSFGTFPLESMKVELIDGSFHAVDSDSLSFELCAKMAYRAALKACSPILLEPIMKLEVVTPEENMGDVVGDLNRRRGMMKGMDDRNGAKVLKADVPLSEMFGYVTQLRTITSGRASSSMEFSHYAEAPRNISDDVVAKSKG